jgi:hypothetical protein
MKKYIALAFFLGFFTCVGCVYGFGMYTTYRIHKQDEANAVEYRKVLEASQHRANFRNPPSALSSPVNPATHPSIPPAPAASILPIPSR